MTYMFALDLLVGYIRCLSRPAFRFTSYLYFFEALQVSMSRKSGFRCDLWFWTENMLAEIFIEVYVAGCRCDSKFAAALR